MQQKKTSVCFKLSSDQCEMTNDSGDIFVGIVTALDADFGFIDGTIFFTKPRFILVMSRSRQPLQKSGAETGLSPHNLDRLLDRIFLGQI